MILPQAFSDRIPQDAKREGWQCTMTTSCEAEGYNQNKLGIGFFYQVSKKMYIRRFVHDDTIYREILVTVLIWRFGDSEVKHTQGGVASSGYLAAFSPPTLPRNESNSTHNGTPTTCVAP